MPTPPNINRVYGKFLHQHIRRHYQIGKNRQEKAENQKRFKRHLRIVRRGQFIPFYLVQANSLIFQAGTGNYYALGLITFDPNLMHDTEYMRELASRLNRLKGTHQSDPDLIFAAELTTDEGVVRDRRRQLPLAMTAGATVYAADLRIVRPYLKNYRLVERVLPCLAEPGDIGAIDHIPWWVAEDVRTPVRFITGVEFPPALLPGETVLWQGKPNAMAFAILRLPVAYAAGLMLSLWWVVFHAWILGTPAHSVNPMYLVVAIAVSFIIIPVYYRRYRMLAEGSMYVITDQRILLTFYEEMKTGHLRSALAEARLEQTQPKLISTLGHIGTIDLGVKGSRIKMNTIDHARHVYRILEQAKSVPPYAEQKISYGRQPRLTTDLEHCMRSDEEILWRQKPDTVVYLIYNAPRVSARLITITTMFAAGANRLGVITLSNFAYIFVISTIIDVALAFAFLFYEARSLEYCVTNRRVLIKKKRGARFEVRDRELAQTAALKVTVGQSDIGSIIFETHRRFIGHGLIGITLHDNFSFFAIQDVDTVASLISATREKLKNRK